MILRKLRYWRELRTHQRLPLHELRRIQGSRLGAIIRHAYVNVPFYRRLFDHHGVKPEEITSPDQLRKLPVITKHDVQANYPDSITARGLDLAGCSISSTSGSTGVPLDICRAPRSIDYVHALAYYAFAELGIGPLERVIDLKVPERLPGGLFSLMLKLVRQEVSILDALTTTAPRLAAMQPYALYGYPSYLSQLARYVRDTGITTIKPRAVFVHGETLSQGGRDLIGGVFEAGVFSLYGSVEFPRVAFECEQHTGLHVITDGSVVEVVDDQGDPVEAGESGHIVITCLSNYAMPLVRFAIGDKGTAGSDAPCPCGRTWPLMPGVEGRADDYILLPSGRTVSPRAINVVEHIKGISRYRTIQETRASFRILVVKDAQWSGATEEEIRMAIKSGCLGEDVLVTVEPVDDIPRDGSGKLRTVISRIGSG